MSTGLSDDDEIMGYEVVTLRVPVRARQDRPGLWRWDHLIDDPEVRVLRAIPEDDIIAEVRFTASDIEAMASGEWMDDEDFDPIPFSDALDSANSAASHIQDAMVNLGAELLFDAVTNCL